MDEELQVVLLHQYPQFTLDCCKLINSEWPRSETARMRSLQSSCDGLPANLILLKNTQVIGHSKLSRIPSISTACFIESVIISNNLRGMGLGTFLMKKVEDYCKQVLKLNLIYLSTKGQEKFYLQLGFEVCTPISIYGNFSIKNETSKYDPLISKCTTPPPPPPPIDKHPSILPRTYMKKIL